MQSPPPIVCVAFVGSDGLLQSFRRFGGENTSATSSLSHVDDLELQLVLYSALDQVEAQLRSANQAIQRGETRPMEPYLGLLTPALLHTEDFNVYGFVSATYVKILAIVREGMSKQRKDEDQTLRLMFRQLHAVHVEATCNPFLDGFDGSSFTKAVDRVVDKHNMPMNWTL
mmetsp:Transcript_60099/g.143217  ORF Transcript_60099/g.143217 Transcript_60099/m.143217 type:complete len:171 (-) Transcript_60099:34-546(-)